MAHSKNSGTYLQWQEKRNRPKTQKKKGHSKTPLRTRSDTWGKTHLRGQCGGVPEKKTRGKRFCPCRPINNGKETLSLSVRVRSMGAPSGEQQTFLCRMGKGSLKSRGVGVKKKELKKRSPLTRSETIPPSRKQSAKIGKAKGPKTKAFRFCLGL